MRAGLASWRWLVPLLSLIEWSGQCSFVVTWQATWSHMGASGSVGCQGGPCPTPGGVTSIAISGVSGSGSANFTFSGSSSGAQFASTGIGSCSFPAGPCTPVSGATTLYATYDGSTCSVTFSNNLPPVYNTLDYCFTNTAAFAVVVTPVVQGSDNSPTCPDNGPQTGPGTTFPMSLAPGDVACWVSPTNCTHAYSVYWDVWYGNGTNVPPATSPTNAASPGGGTNVTGTGVVSIPGPGSGGGGAGPTVPPGAGSGSNTNLTGGQYYNGIQALNSTIYQGFQSLLNDTNFGNNSGAVSSGTLSNGVYGGLFGASGAGIGGAGSGYGTNQYSDYGGFRTNVQWSDGLTALGSVGTVIAGITNSANGLSNAWASGTPASDSSLLFSNSSIIPGYTVTIDPSAVMPGAPALIRQLINWVASVGFVLWCIKKWEDAVYASLATHVGSVADFEVNVAGFGGNIFGFLCWIVVPFVLGAVWIVVLDVVLGVARGALTQIGSSPFAAFTSTTAKNALYLLYEFVDWAYLLGLLAGRITYGFFFPWLAAVGGFASRLLPG